MKNTIFLFCMLFFFSCDPLNSVIENEDVQVFYYEAATKSNTTPPSDSLRVASWNVKFGGGRLDFFFDCHGDESIMKAEQVETHLAGLAAKINQMEVDVLYVQELDVESKRSAYIDQLQSLLDATDFNYAVYASQWDSDYVPSDGVGRINSGNAILSRFPLENAERIALPLIEEQSGLVQYFYLRRNILKAKIIDVQGQPIWLLNTHTSAFATDGTKDKQLERIKVEVDKLEAEGTPFVLGGDFNSLPPSTLQTRDFSDDACPADSDYSTNDFSAEQDIMLPFYDFEPLIPLADYAANNADYLSYTSDKNGFWSRKLDYMFTNTSFNSGLVHIDQAHGGMETMPLSDHAPLSGIVTNW